jgi:CBS domain-containing protein
MFVRDVMTSKVITIPFTSTIREAVQILVGHKISGAPVVDGTNQLIGIVSEKGIFRKLYPSYNEFHEEESSFWNFERIESRATEVANLKVVEVMSPRVICVHPDFPLAKAGGLILAKSIHRLVITDNGKEDGKIVGIITRNDIYKALFQKEFDLP